MIPKKIYLREAEFDDLSTSERMVSCDEPYEDLIVEFTNLSQVWHDLSEEPQKGKLILLEVVNTIPEKNEVRYFVEYVEEWVVNLMKTEGFQTRWAYINDILPKGGEK